MSLDASWNAVSSLSFHGELYSLAILGYRKKRAPMANVNFKRPIKTFSRMLLFIPKKVYPESKNYFITRSVFVMWPLFYFLEWYCIPIDIAMSSLP